MELQGVKFCWGSTFVGGSKSTGGGGFRVLACADTGARTPLAIIATNKVR
jgi:hypothetical protein